MQNKQVVLSFQLQLINKIQHVRNIYHNAWFFSMDICHVRGVQKCIKLKLPERGRDVWAHTHFTSLNTVGYLHVFMIKYGNTFFF